MAGVKAFRALRYTAKAGALADLIAPPYDIIGAEERRRLAARGPYSHVHLSLPEGEDEGGLLESRYQHARGILSQWLANGIVAVEDAPSLTVVRERFRVGGEERVRTGVHVALRLDRYGEGDVYPHEWTLEGPRTDRLRLMRATKANLSPVFALVPDKAGELRAWFAETTAREPDQNIQGPDEAARSVWIERAPERAARLERACEGVPAVIADGHHRYETGLAYRDELAAAGRDPAEAVRILCHVVAIEDPGLVVLPTHRVVTPHGRIEPARFLEDLRARFDLAPADREDAAEFARSVAARGAPQEFIVAVGRPLRVFRARLRDPAEMARRAPDRATAWRTLDVPCLHLLVMQDVLGISPEAVAGGGLVSYTRDAGTTLAAAEGEGGVGFVLRATPPQAVLEVARSGEKMPQKSTYFFPKVAAGIAMRLIG